MSKEGEGRRDLQEAQERVGVAQCHSQRRHHRRCPHRLSRRSPRPYRVRVRVRHTVGGGACRCSRIHSGPTGCENRPLTLNRRRQPCTGRRYCAQSDIYIMYITLSANDIQHRSRHFINPVWPSFTSRPAASSSTYHMPGLVTRSRGAPLKLSGGVKDSRIGHCAIVVKL